MDYKTKLKIFRFLLIFTFFQFLVYYINHNFDLIFLKEITIKTISFLGFETNNNAIYLPQISCSLKIVNMCTGILMYFTLISLFFAFFSFKRALIYSILFIPVVFILNLIRIILTCIIIQKFGYVGVIFHDVYWISDGIFTFILFYIVYKINEKINAK